MAAKELAVCRKSARFHGNAAGCGPAFGILVLNIIIGTMKQTLLSIALLLMAMFVTSGYNRDNAGLAPGEFAPALSATAKEKSISLYSMRGSCVLLAFWTSADAASRIQANAYGKWAESNSEGGLRFVGVNFDEEPALFEEIARRDNLDLQSQINVQGDEARKIMKDFSLDHGFGALLVGPDGRIIAVNPSTSALNEFMRDKAKKKTRS